jgi:hypothetical protein
MARVVRSLAPRSIVLPARRARVQLGVLRVVPGLSARLREVGRLVALPLVEDLIVEDGAVYDQDDKACG